MPDNQKVDKASNEDQDKSTNEPDRKEDGAKKGDIPKSNTKEGESTGGNTPSTKKDEDKKDDGKSKSLADEMKEAVVTEKEGPSSKPEELAFFERQKKEEHYTIWNLDHALEQRIKNRNVFFRFLIEVSLIFVIFIGPSIVWLYKEWGNISFSKYFSTPGPLTYDSESVFRLGLFVVIWYTFDCFVRLICDNVIVIMGSVLSSLQLDESEFIWGMVDNFYSSRLYFRTCVVFLFIFQLSNLLLEAYTPPTSYNLFDPKVMKAFVLWYGIYSGLMFVMKFAVNIFIYDIKRSSYSGAIWDLNNKTFIFKKLDAISEVRGGSAAENIYTDMMPNYDPGLYLKDNDLFLSKEDAEAVAQNIMVLLKKKNLVYSDIKRYFPSNHEKVFKYLSNSEAVDEKQKVSVSALKDLAKALYSKRVDMNRSLKDRNYIFDKLESIFSILVKYVSAIVLCVIFNINYKIYIASFGTSLLTFSWIFADTIKKLFNCFVFVLVVRPYDIGDRVNIEGQNYVVYQINLLNTTFLTNLKKLAYIPNDKLFSSNIYNIARSPPQSVLLEISVDENTTYDMATSVVNKLEEEIKKSKKHFTNLKLHKLADGKLFYIIYTTQNFQNLGMAHYRQKKLIKMFEDGLRKVGIKHKNSFSFID